MAFEATGSEIAGVAVDFEGLIPDELPQRPTSLLYVTPSHQFPTGHTLSLARRHAIVAWARRYGCYILEDDCDGDFALRRLAAAGDRGARAGLHDLSRHVLADARRRAAARLHGRPAAARRRRCAREALLNNGNPWLEQAALAEMMQGRFYAAHLLRIRAYYRESRDGLMTSLRRNFGDVNVSGEAGGLHLFWHLPAGVPDAGARGLARRAGSASTRCVAGGAMSRAPRRCRSAA